MSVRISNSFAATSAFDNMLAATLRALFGAQIEWYCS